MIAAEVPETEAAADRELLTRLLANTATHQVLAEYVIKDESFVGLYRLVPISEHRHPFVLAGNGGDDLCEQYLVFGSWRAAEDAFAWWVEFLRECHKEYCDLDPGKCGHAPPYASETPKTVRRKKPKSQA